MPAPRFDNRERERFAAGVLRCPYHAWTYELNGKLLGTPEFEGVDEWNRSEVCLPQFQVETWGPLVFVNQNAAAPSLVEVWGDIPRQAVEFGCPLEQLRLCARRDYVINCNWKVYVDNYLEGYHLPAVHPGSFANWTMRNIESIRSATTHRSTLPFVSSRAVARSPL